MNRDILQSRTSMINDKHTSLRNQLAEARKIVEGGNNHEGERLLLDLVAPLEELSAHSVKTEDGEMSVRVEALLDLADIQCRLDKYEESRRRAELALSLALECDNDEQRSRALHILAKAFLFQRQFADALPRFLEALALARKVGNQRSSANILSNIGLFYLEQGDIEKALDYYSESLPLHELIHNHISIAITALQIGLIYDDLLQHEKSLEYNLRALAIFEELDMIADVGSVLNNIGFNYANLGNYQKSRESYLRSIAIHEQTGNTVGAPYPYTNLGDLLRQMGHYEESYERLNAGLALTRSVGDLLQEARTLAYLARLFATEEFAGLNIELSRQYTLESLALFEKIGATDSRSKTEIVKQHFLLADLYKRQQNFEAALYHFNEYHNLDKEVRSQVVLAKTAQFEQRITLATERADAEATKRLLHKTLPKIIADRVIRGEEHIADHFDSVSILFADIVGFTNISASLPPSAVLGFMNFLFEHFDRIAAKFECERIKTIGDGYMAVCGAPVQQPNHAEQIAHMALEMMEDIFLPEHIREHLPNGTVLHLRIGLHCGEITAGLIGTGKLAYDVYGDAVNTAARMESHGEAGRIHCSNDFCLHLQERFAMTKDATHGFVFVKRGETEIKGKGMMRTYFLEKA